MICLADYTYNFTYNFGINFTDIINFIVACWRFIFFVGAFGYPIALCIELWKRSWNKAVSTAALFGVMLLINWGTPKVFDMFCDHAGLDPAVLYNPDNHSLKPLHFLFPTPTPE
jgi:predicted Na+-dependent transporter